ncbi:hypothetical protein A4G19_08845 [Pasteurellaceae bacterium Macca]|nr:hypothetical protein [Pasteurellaceae bacterium Macca]
MKKYILTLAFLLATGNLFAEDAKDKPSEPLFKDGKGYYSYVKPLNLPPLANNKVQLQYFYHYGCEVCLTALDTLKAYAKRHSEQVALTISPSFEKGSTYTSQMNATFEAAGKPELSELFLFDSTYQNKEKNHLVKNNQAIIRWLEEHNVNTKEFYRLFTSEKVRKQVEEDHKRYQQYLSPPFSPYLAINGKYILVKNTLFNDDYTFAVLDFLVNKLTQEKEK